VSTPRAHHYVPRTYLAGFTDAEERLFVTHKDTGKVRRSRPIREAHQRDYYRLEEGDDLLAVEKFFGQFEDRWPEVRRAVLDAHGLPDDPELRAFLMGFMSAQVVRVPGTLDGWDRFHDEVLKKVAWYLTATPEAWAAHVERMREAGDPVPNVSYEEMRKFVLSEDYTITLDQNSRLAPLVQATPAMAEMLARRTWTLVESELDFITSDRPVTVCWNDPPKGLWPPPGLGVRGTTVMFPMTSRAALIGMFEGPFPTTTANEMLVGILNMWSAYYATRFLYNSAEDFRVVLPDGSAGGREDYFRHRASSGGS